MTITPDSLSTASQRWDHTFRHILQEILQSGTRVEHHDATSVGHRRPSIELRNHQFTIDDPRDRILRNPERDLNLSGAVARFLWMLSGNDRVKDIAFYEPRVLGFTDDQMTVPGSNYGKRLFTPEPGVDQVKAIVERVRRDPGTRRAVAAIYRPEDAVRESKDIPCAFGLSFHARNDRLHMTTIMRSNAAWTLLPYNVFEFSLLGELIATLAGKKLGSYTHIALSMHLYENEIDHARRACDAEWNEIPPPMPPMPDGTTWDQLIELAKWEADLRYQGTTLSSLSYRPLLESARKFGPYWSNYGFALLGYVLKLRGKLSLRREVLAHCTDVFGAVLRDAAAVEELDQPSLEDDVVMLESRKNLLDYAEREALGTGQREELWATYASEVAHDARRQEPGERRRREAVRVVDWGQRDARRIQEKQRPTLFD